MIDTVQAEKCIALQQEEQEVMQSIDADSVTFSASDLTGTQVHLRVSVDFEEPRQALVTTVDGVLATSDPSYHPSCEDNISCGTSFAAEVTLSHLPPIDLTLLLPPGYPLYEPATIMSLDAMYSWITATDIEKLWAFISDITQEGVENGGEGILWRIYELLRDGHVLSILELCDGPHLHIPHPTPEFLVPLLLSHSISAASEKFEKQSYPCPICLITVPGSKCMRIDKCGHVCCKSCLSDFWMLSIEQGEVEKVGCVDESCVKISAKNANDPQWTPVGEDQVRQIVGEALLQRWIDLQEKRMVERGTSDFLTIIRAQWLMSLPEGLFRNSEPTMVRCPNRICQALVPKPPLARDPGDEEYTNWDNLRSCQSCDLSFCLACRKTWHGPIATCGSINNDLIQSYLSATPKSKERLRIERQYGKKLIGRLATGWKHNKEEKKSKEWVEANTMSCPGCIIKVEKSSGCNHVRYLFALLSKSILSSPNQRTNVLVAFHTDEMCEVCRTLLLSVWPEAPHRESLHPFFNEGDAMLWESLLMTVEFGVIFGRHTAEAFTFRN
ncbi:translation termination inhibitor protein itt1 [Tulasnella sp. JGI-2019a]|nr:translation termination inhibitor protein itt1 [Tulasnella sp. JGI-2019a]